MTRDGVAFDYIAKEGKRRTITVTDEAVRAAVRALIRSDNSLGPLFCFQDGGTWQPLRSHEVSSYIATRAGGHFTAKEFRTWNATVLMALLLANAGPAPTPRSRKTAITSGIRGVANWLGDTPAVTRSSYIDPRGDQPVRGRRAASHDPEAARNAARRRGGRGRRRYATRY